MILYFWEVFVFVVVVCAIITRETDMTESDMLNCKKQTKLSCTVLLLLLLLIISPILNV